MEAAGFENQHRHRRRPLAKPSQPGEPRSSAGPDTAWHSGCPRGRVHRFFCLFPLLFFFLNTSLSEIFRRLLLLLVLFRIDFFFFSDFLFFISFCCLPPPVLSPGCWGCSRCCRGPRGCGSRARELRARCSSSGAARGLEGGGEGGGLGGSYFPPAPPTAPVGVSLLELSESVQ